jgi:hypothetical protein
MSHRTKFGWFAVVVLLMTGCATAKRPAAVAGCAPLHVGRHLDGYWSAPDFNRQAMTKIYFAPVETSQIKDRPGVSVADVVQWFTKDTVATIHEYHSWSLVDRPDESTTKLLITITYFTPGSAAGRIWAGEFGAGSAIVQIEGKLIESATGKQLACFFDDRRDTGAVGFEDMTGEIGPKLVKRTVRRVATNVIRELADDLQAKP